MAHPRVLFTVLVALALARARAGAGQELPVLPYPREGAIGPHTYLPDQSLTGCTALITSAASVPWDPTTEAAEAYCSGDLGCGGFLYTTSQASLAAGGADISQAEYCSIQSFTAGTPSATSAIAFVRMRYNSCHFTLRVPETVESFHGTFATTRAVCITFSRLRQTQDPSPKPNALRSFSRPRKVVELDGTNYEVGVDVFITAEAARNASVDGTSHAMSTSLGITYHMPGQTHALREQSARPFALDGWYPLYLTEAAAQAAAVRAGLDGHAVAVGPTLGAPAMWSEPPHSQVYYMPQGIPLLYRGDYVVPSELDGYFPLYYDRADAESASDDGTATAHGPASSSGHPLAWSSGQQRELYMPSSSAQLSYGDYETEALPGDYEFWAPLAAELGQGPQQAAAAVAAAAAAAR